jgi:hypothetical protein
MSGSMKAIVRSGRLVLDEPTDLPEGTEVSLVATELDEELDEVDRARLHAALDRSLQEFVAGDGRPAREALAWLRGRRA